MRDFEILIACSNIPPRKLRSRHTVCMRNDISTHQPLNTANCTIETYFNCFGTLPLLTIRKLKDDNKAREVQNFTQITAYVAACWDPDSHVCSAEMQFSSVAISLESIETWSLQGNTNEREKAAILFYPVKGTVSLAK